MLPGSWSRAIRAEAANFKFDVSDGEAVLVLERFFEAVNMGTAELDDFLAGNADEVMVLLIAGSLKVTMVLLQVCRLDEPLLAQEVKCAVHGGEADAVAALPGYLKDLVRAQMPGLFADDLQYRLALSREAASG